MAIASQVTTPTLVHNDDGRYGVVVYDNPNVTNNTHKSCYVVYSDGTWKQSSRSALTVVPGAPTGPAAFSSFAQYTGSTGGVGPGA